MTNKNVFKFLKPLPHFLKKRYNNWKATTYIENKKLYEKLAIKGQKPNVMIVSCCDSRVHISSIFGSEAGEFFIHRNIANLIPPYKLNTDYHGTSAAIEYAVDILKVSHLIVLGHSSCGGVSACLDYFSVNEKKLNKNTSFVRSWLEILRPSFEEINTSISKEEQVKILEKKSVIASLENVLTFPFIKKALENQTITLYGLWHDIQSGDLLFYDTLSNKFKNV